MLVASLSSPPLRRPVNISVTANETSAWIKSPRETAEINPSQLTFKHQIPHSERATTLKACHG